MKIGKFEIETGAFLAPMAGISDAVFRSMCKNYGASLTCTEMISAAGLYYQPKKSRALMTMEEGKGPFAVQIFGNDPKIMAAMSKKYFTDYDIIDINMGCPAPKIVKGGAGSALMKTPEIAEEIVKRIKDATDKVVTCKIRSGWDENDINALEFAESMQKAGADAITLHARTRTQFYSGEADWSLIKELKKQLVIPVIGNGDVVTPEDARRMLDETGCDGVMVGRGAHGRPYVFHQIKEYLQTGKIVQKPSIDKIMDDALSHAKGLMDIFGEKNAVMMMRKHLAWYIKGERNAAGLRNMAVKVSSFDDIVGFAKVVCKRIDDLA